MSQLGTQVITSETPPAVQNSSNTANAFFVGVADWGPSGASGVNTPVSSMAQAAAVIGAPSGSTSYGAGRSATNANLYDALDAFFGEGGSTAYISPVLAPSGRTSATIALAPSAALTLTAQYPGVGGNGIKVAVQNNTTTYTITLSDTNGNVLTTSPALATVAAGVTWAATTGLVTAVSSGSTLPSTATATAMSGGANGTTPTITEWTAAINAFGANLGPGQILAPGQTNTTLSGIWSALALHASQNNRVAICDETDGASISTITSDVSGAAIASALQGYMGIWAGSRLIPGIVGGTSRTVPPSPIIAALCARVDQTGNPNLPPAGASFPLQYARNTATIVSGTQDTYSAADLGTLNSIGVNGFQAISNIPQNYGFATLVPPTSDLIYWQFNHARLRMALVSQSQFVTAPFFASQADGQGSTATRLNQALSAMFGAFYDQGALYGQNKTDAFTVNTGPSVNTALSLSQGTLAAQCSAEMSPGIQLVLTYINAVPITRTLLQTANPAQNQ